MWKNQIFRCHLSLLLKTAVLLSDFSKNFERLLLSEKNIFSKIFLHFFIAFESNNGNMLWPIGIFLFGRKVPIWTTLGRTHRTRSKYAPAMLMQMLSKINAKQW